MRTVRILVEGLVGLIGATVTAAIIAVWIWLISLTIKTLHVMQMEEVMGSSLLIIIVGAAAIIFSLPTIIALVLLKQDLAVWLLARRAKARRKKTKK